MSIDEVSIDIDDAEGPVALVTIRTPTGDGRLLGQLRFEGKVLYVEAAHVEGLAPGALGRQGINVVLRKMLVEADVERIVIQGARRTQARTEVKSPAPSSSPVELRIDLTSGLESPVTLAVVLRDNGIGLARAHAVVTELADKQTVLVTVRPRNLEDLLARLRDLGLVAGVPSQARAV